MTKRRYVHPKISVVGLGYVGLCTAVCFADRGFRVYGVEVDEEKCKRISEGSSPIHEPGLDQILKSSLRSGLFSCHTDYEEAIEKSDITFVTVGTPSKPTGEIDLRYIESAAGEIGRHLALKQSYHTVVMKSTVVPGTTEGTVKRVLEETSRKSTSRDIGLCVNPEFLREGSAIKDTFHSDALIIGSSEEKPKKVLSDLYTKFYGKKLVPPTLLTTTSSCEFVKYAVNTFRATQLSFLNTLANLCDRTPSADVVEVIRGLASVTKIDPRYLRAGFGYGGSCLPKDLRALTARTRELGVNPVLLQAAAEINEQQPLTIFSMARELIGDLKGKRIALLGLAFKAQTDDVRESVAIKIANALCEAGAKVVAYDPKGMDNAKKLLDAGVSLANSAQSSLSEADLCVIATEWPEFSKIKPEEYVALMKTPAVIDGKRIVDTAKFAFAGIRIKSLGRHGFEGPAKEIVLTSRDKRKSTNNRQ